eukprot:GGOE01058390.1.p1 GENE.GGOE01058390.1~~GGOE01058390.1.p1  ORF type:complete len:436 (-),score=83.01 GGOE01058390.1:2457-3725(-)
MSPVSPRASAKRTVTTPQLEPHVYPGSELVRWVRGVLNRQESCLAFVCGAAGSGKSHLALQASFELGSSACIVSDDLFYEDYNALPMQEFTKALESTTQSPPMAIICDGVNAEVSEFASKVVLGLGAGIASRQISWFVLDKGLPEAQEVRTLQKARPFSLGPEKAELPIDATLEQVRKLRATFFRNGALVRWTDTFVSTEMLRSCWQEVLDWDSLRPQQSQPTIPYVHDNSAGLLTHVLSQDDEAIGLASSPHSGPVHLTAGWAFSGTIPGPMVPKATHFPPAAPPATSTVGPASWLQAPPVSKITPPPPLSQPLLGPRKPVALGGPSPPVAPSMHYQSAAPSGPNPLSALLAQCNLNQGLHPNLSLPVGQPHLPLSRPLTLSRESSGGDPPKPIGLTLGSVLNDYMKGSKPCADVPQMVRC